MASDRRSQHLGADRVIAQPDVFVGVAPLFAQERSPLRHVDAQSPGAFKQ
jgi:hypothetical protein